MSRKPTLLLAGIAANLSVPVTYLVILIPLLGRWHNSDEMTAIIVGLGLVASMPIAGSSTGWAQHAGADMALSLGLVVASTLLSPFSTPVVLRLLGTVSPDRAAAALHQVGGRETGLFLTAWVLIPSLLGIGLRQLVPDRFIGRLEGMIKPLSTLCLLVLCYANASACLPQAVASQDWDFLGTTTVAVLGMCMLTFAMGYAVGRFLHADRQARAALMYGLGMNNNGTGLVLASSVLASRPVVLLPIILYNLGQHLVAGCVHEFSGGANDSR